MTPRRQRAKKLELPLEFRHDLQNYIQHKLGHWVTRGENDSNTRRARYACLVEAHETTRTRIGKIDARGDGDLNCRQGSNSLTHYNLVHKPIPISRAMNTLRMRKPQLTRSGQSSKKVPAWHVTLQHSQNCFSPNVLIFLIRLPHYKRTKSWQCKFAYGW